MLFAAVLIDFPNSIVCLTGNGALKCTVLYEEEGTSRKLNVRELSSQSRFEMNVGVSLGRVLTTLFT